MCGACVPVLLAALVCPRCAAPLRTLAADAAPGAQLRTVRYGRLQLTFDVEQRELTRARLAALLDVPPDRLTLLAHGRRVHTEAEVAVCDGGAALVCFGTPRALQLTPSTGSPSPVSTVSAGLAVAGRVAWQFLCSLPRVLAFVLQLAYVFVETLFAPPHPVAAHVE